MIFVTVRYDGICYKLTGSMNSKNRILAIVLGIAFVARLGYGLVAPAKETNGRVKDIDHYTHLAQSMAEHGQYSDLDGKPSAEREPMYPLVLAILFKLCGQGYYPFLVAQALLSTGTLWLLFILAQETLGTHIGLGAAAIGAMYPQFVYYTALSARETWTTFIDLLSIWLVLRALATLHPRDFAGAGICAAIAALSATTFLPFALLVVPLLILVLMGRPRRGAFGCAGMYLAALVALYSFWPLRNYAVLHRWVLGSTSASGNHFYLFMVVPQELGGTLEEYRMIEKDATWQKGYSLPSADRENFFWKAGLEKIRQNPSAYIRLVAWRFFIDQWRFAPRPRDYGHSYRFIWWISILSDGWILPLGFLGLGLSRLRPLVARLGLAFILSTALTYSLVLTMIRYRLVLMPWMILYAVYGCAQINKQCHQSA
jgi:hypothetical protein